MNDKTFRRHHRDGRLRGLTLAAAGFTLGAIALMWSWNTVAVDLFGAAEARLVHAISFEFALLTILLTWRAATRAYDSTHPLPRG